MAVTFRSATGGQSSTTALNIAAAQPAGAAASDLVFVGITVKDSQTFTANTGWTLEQNANANSNAMTTAVYYRVLDGTETWPITFSWTGSSVKRSWVVAAFTPGAGNSMAIDGEAAVKVDTTATTHTANAQTAVAANVCSVIFNLHRNSASGSTGATVTPPTSWTEPTNGDQTTASGTSTALSQLGAEICYSTGQSGTVTPGSCTLSLTGTQNTYHFLITDPAPETSPALELSGFGADTLVHSYDTINSVKVSYTHHETAGTLAPTLQLWDYSGTPAQVGATFTCTTSTSDITDTAVFTGVVYSQLATLRVRVTASGTTGHVESADAVGIVINYTAGTPPVTGAAAGAGAVNATGFVVPLATQAMWLTGPDSLPGLPGGQAFEAWPVWEGSFVPLAAGPMTGTASAAGAGAVTAKATLIAPASGAGAGLVTAKTVQAAPATATGAGAVTAKTVQIAGASAAGAGAVSDVVTQIAIGAAAGAGAETALSTQVVAQATATGAAAVSDVVTQIAFAITAGAGAVSDVATQIAPASAAGAGAATASGSSSGSSGGNANGAGSVSALVTEIAPATGAGAGAVTDVVTQASSAAAAGAGAVSDVVTQIAPATGSGAAAVSDVVTQIAFAAAAGAGSVTAAGSSSGSANGAAAGAGSVTAVATLIAPASGNGSGAIADVVTQIAKAAAAAAAASVSAGQITGTSSVAGTGNVTGNVIQGVTGGSAGNGTSTALVTERVTGAAAGAGAVSATSISLQAVIRAHSLAAVTHVNTGASTVTDPRDGIVAVLEKATTTASVS